MAARRQRDDDEPRGRKRGGGEDLDFTPVDYDLDDMPVDAAEGEYTVKFKKVAKSKSKKDGYPQIIIDARLTEAVEEDGEEAVKRGCVLTTYITFFPAKEGRRGIPSKRALKDIVKALKIDEALVPKRIESGRDLDELVDALKGAELPAWVTHRDDDSGETRCDLRFKAPRTSGGGSDKRKSRDDDEDDRPRRNGKADRDDERRAANGNGRKARDRDEDADEEEEDEEDEDRPRVNARGGSDRKDDDRKGSGRRASKDDEDEDEDEDDRPRARARSDRDEEEDRPRSRR